MGNHFFNFFNYKVYIYEAGCQKYFPITYEYNKFTVFMAPSESFDENIDCKHNINRNQTRVDLIDILFGVFQFQVFLYSL